MKKTLGILISILLLICMGCTATDKNYNQGAESTENTSSETPTGWATNIEGRYLKAFHGHLIISEHGPIELRTTDESIFDDLTDGDLIGVACQYIEESYPGGTDVGELWKIEDGEYSQIDTKVLAQLAELGWIELETEDNEAVDITGYYFKKDDGHYILVEDDVIYLYPHPDMIEDVEVLHGYTDGDLIKVNCELHEDNGHQYGKVWFSKLVEEGTPENIPEGTGE